MSSTRAPFLEARAAPGGTGLVGSGDTITNFATGAISGGAGSSVGGVGIVSSGGTSLVDQGGVISGGTGSGGARANAITFTGGGNSLEIWAGSVINGNVAAGGTDTLLLGGAANSAFDVSKVGPTAQYEGFGQYVKTGTSTWTLINSTTAVTPWTINQGGLSVSFDSNLGAASVR